MTLWKQAYVTTFDPETAESLPANVAGWVAPEDFFADHSGSLYVLKEAKVYIRHAGQEPWVRMMRIDGLLVIGKAPTLDRAYSDSLWQHRYDDGLPVYVSA